MADSIPLPANLTAQDWQLIVSILVRQPYSEVHTLLARLEGMATVEMPLPTPPYQHPPPRPPE